MILKSNRKKYRYFTSMALAIGLMVLGMSLFYFGSHQTHKSYQKLLGKNQLQKDKVVEQQRYISELQVKITKLEQTLEVERFQREKEVTLANALQNQVFDLEEKLKFYKISIGSENIQTPPLSIRRFELKPTDMSQKYKFNIVLATPKHVKTPVNGEIKFTLIGLQQGKSVSIPLDKRHLLTEPNFKFKLIQEVQGMLTIPEDVIPQKIQVKAVVAGQKQAEEKSYPWPTTKA